LARRGAALPDRRHRTSYSPGESAPSLDRCAVPQVGVEWRRLPVSSSVDGTPAAVTSAGEQSSVLASSIFAPLVVVSGGAVGGTLVSWTPFNDLSTLFCRLQLLLLEAPIVTSKSSKAQLLQRQILALLLGALISFIGADFRYTAAI